MFGNCAAILALNFLLSESLIWLSLPIVGTFFEKLMVYRGYRLT
jgi:hypothetical protein